MNNQRNCDREERSFIITDVKWNADNESPTASVIPKHKMATPFCAFKTLTGFGFQFTEV
jgi:hypothetical protein